MPVNPLVRAAITCALLAAVSAESGAQLRWIVDTAESTVSFSVKHLVIRTVTGTFGRFAGSVQAIDSTFRDALIEADIEAATIDTGRPERDRNLRSKDFLHVAQHPWIRFRSTSVRQVGPRRYAVSGALTLRGTTRAIELRAELTSADSARARVRAEGVINRFDFGLRFSETDWDNALGRAAPIVGDSVRIVFDVVLRRDRR